MPEPVYVWDIDRTIVRSSLERHFLKYLRNEVGSFSLWKAAWHWLGLSFRLPPPPLWRTKLAYLRDFTVSEVDYWFETCFSSRVIPALYAGSVTAIRKLRTENKQLVLVSGTPRPFADRMAKHLGIEHLIAAEPEIADNRYTGRLLYPHPHAKYKVAGVQRLLDDRGWTWEQVVALADHHDDEYLLGRAGRAIAVNPAEKLKQTALARGWTVVKDASPPNAIVSLL